MTKDLSRVGIRARWEQQIEKAVIRFGGKEAVASRVGVDVRTVGNWLGVKPHRGTKGRGSNGRKKVDGIRVGTIPRDAEFAAACDSLGISANYILFNRRPELLEDEFTQDWMAGMCDWLVHTLNLPAGTTLDGPRVRAFILEAIRAAEAHDDEVFNEVRPMIEMAREILRHRCRGDDDSDGFRTYRDALGEPEQRKQWQGCLSAAEARFERAPYIGILRQPRWTRETNTDRNAAAVMVSNIDLVPVPQLAVSIVTKLEVRHEKRRRAK